MKKKKVEPDEMRAEYTLSGGVKNPYATRFTRGTNLVLIEPELFKAFPGTKEVNNALRILLKAGAQAVKGTAKAS
jgi:hypothetical protein